MNVLADRRFAGFVLLVLVVCIGLFVVRAIRHAAAASGGTPAAATAVLKSPLVSPNSKLASLPATTGFSIDVVSQKSNSTVAGQSISIPIDSGAPLTILGWAADTPDHALASKVYAAINGTQWFDCSYGEERADVAKVLSNPALAKSGFKCVIPAGKLPSGSDSLAVAIVNATGTGFYTGASSVTLSVQ
jgi:hypothetical protein